MSSKSWESIQVCLQLGGPNTPLPSTVQSKVKQQQRNAKQCQTKQSKAMQSKAMQSKLKQCKAMQSKAKRSKAKQIKAMQSKAKQHYPSVTVTRSRGGYYYLCPRGSCILMVYEMLVFHKDITPVFPRVGPRIGRPTGALRAAHHQRHGRITTGRLSLPFWFKMCPLVRFLAALLWPHSDGEHLCVILDRQHFEVFVAAAAKQQVRCRTGSTANRSSL